MIGFGRARQFASNAMVRNSISLYGVQFCRKLLPIVSIPYLARTLGPTGWGKVAFVQAMSEFIVLTLEFGFNLSATREIAQNRTSPEKCGEIVAGTFGAQVVLAMVALLAATLISTQIPMLRREPILVFAGLFYALMQGLAPLWFFQGLERIAFASFIEIVSKVIALAGIFLWIHHANDEWKVLVLQGLAPAVSTVAGVWLAYSTVPFFFPSRALVWKSLQQGWQMFLLRSSASLYTVGNSFILGLFASPAIVAYYASAEKLSKAISGLLLPIRDSIYPRLSHLVVHSPEESAKLARLGAILMVGGGLFLSAATWWSAPFLIHALVGKQFEESIPVLRILALLPTIIAVTDSVGLQYLLPRRREDIVNRIMLLGGLLNIGLATIVARRYKDVGMAWSVLVVEIAVCLMLVRVVQRMTAKEKKAFHLNREAELKTEVARA